MPSPLGIFKGRQFKPSVPANRVFRYIVKALILCLFHSPNIKAQDSLRYGPIDAYAIQSAKALEHDLPHLVAQLIAPAKNDFEKARSLFTWLVHYLQFDDKAYRKGNKRLNRNTDDILRRRKAVCFGYAQLYRQLCKQAALPCYIISGYSKQSPVDQQRHEQPNHAWNAVKLEGRWYLLDATWASNLRLQPNEFMRKYKTDYFLTPPALFILEHLPADPMWQLLPCPLPADQFWQSPASLRSWLTKAKPCFAFADSLALYETLNSRQQKLATAFRAYHFLPSTGNARELGATYMDHEYELSVLAEALQERRAFDSLRLVQQQMLSLCEQAGQLGVLFDNQLENCAYTHINYAVALADAAEKEDDPESRKRLHQKMRQHFQKAAEQLAAVPQTVFVQQARERCVVYLEWLEEEVRRMVKKILRY